MSVKDKADAIDRFVRTLKSAGLYDDIGSAAIMAGWTNLAGALYPFKGSAPTNGGGLFQDADLDPGIGLRGNGSTKYLDSNRANNADGKDDNHNAVWISAAESSGATGYYIDSGAQSVGDNNLGRSGVATNLFVRNRSQFGNTVAKGDATGFIGHSRSSSSTFSIRAKDGTDAIAATSESPSSGNIKVFARPGTAFSNATLSWYSIGSSTDLAALDSAVSTLMSDLRAIDEDGFEPESVNYIRAVEAADGAYLETGVKKAINSFIVGCRKDGIWDAIKASCILCGARTIAGALVPLSVDYGPELVDIENLPTPLISDAGTSGEWDAASRTMSNNDPASDSRGSYPRYSFSYAGSGGKRWLVTGRLTGDTANVNAILFGTIPVSYNAATGEFSGVVVAAGGWLEIQCRTDVARVFSVTIEELSIRQDRSTPTAYNFTSSNYNRETGLVGVQASGTYIDTNRANNADPQNDNHNAAYVTTPAVGVLLASSSNLDGQNYLDITSTPATRLFSRSNTLFEQQVGAASAGLYSISRGNGSSFDFLTPQGSGTKVAASETTDTRNVLLYTRSNDGVSFSAFSSARIAFYSIGSAISDLALLDARVSTLVSQIAAAIP